MLERRDRDGVPGLFVMNCFTLVVIDSGRKCCLIFNTMVVMGSNGIVWLVKMVELVGLNGRNG